MNDGQLHHLKSRAMSRDVWMWTFGWWGEPVLIFPTAGGMAHDWKSNKAIAALWPLVAAGRIKLYCPETNVAECWTHGEGSPEERLKKHQQYEAFLVNELVPWIRRDCNSPNIRISAAGASVGGWYAVNTALKHPELIKWALSLSGRFAMEQMLDGWWSDDLYYELPFQYVPGLSGDALRKVQQNTAFTFVVGQGAHEGACLPETIGLAHALHAKGIHTELDVWGTDVAHEWPWWHRQLRLHFGRRFGA